MSARATGEIKSTWLGDVAMISREGGGGGMEGEGRKGRMSIFKKQMRKKKKREIDEKKVTG